MSEQMQASELLDRVIGERVFGWDWVQNEAGVCGWASNPTKRDETRLVSREKWEGVWVHPQTPEFSSDDGEAWSVVDRMIGLGFGASVAHPRGKLGWFAHFDSAKDQIGVPATHADTPALAICLAALAALDRRAERQANNGAKS